MKKWICLLLALLTMCSLVACNTSPDQSSSTSAPSTSGSSPVAGDSSSEPPASEPDSPPVLTADQLEEGTYSITVDSSSSMFNIVDAQLTVADGAMTCVITMSGQGYGMLFMGTGEEALAAGEDSYIPFVLDEEGSKTFTVPVEALNAEIDCAAWSIRKERWYDRVLVFRSDDIPAEAITAE